MSEPPATPSVDLATILAADDPWTLVAPVWRLADPDDGPQICTANLARFSQPQRCAWAIHWYQAEVNNGGHQQFFFNPAGHAWSEALRGFEMIGLSRFADILREAITRLGGDPPVDRELRIAALAARNPDFSDLDEAFYAAEEADALSDRLIAYAHANPHAFVFEP